MAEQWTLKGREVQSCICDSPCPCVFGEDPTKGYCQGIIGLEISEGSYGSVDLSSRSIALLVSWEGNVFSGDITFGVLVDEDASDEQLEALEQITTGKAGGMFETLSGLYGEVKGVKRAPIQFADGDEPGFRIGDSSYRVEPLIGADQQNPLVVTNSPFDFAGAGLSPGKSEGGKFTDSDWGFEFEEMRYGQLGKLDLSSP